MLPDLVPIVPLDDRVRVSNIKCGSAGCGTSRTPHASWAINDVLLSSCSSFQHYVQCNGIKGHQFQPKGLLRAFRQMRRH